MCVYIYMGELITVELINENKEKLYTEKRWVRIPLKTISFFFKFSVYIGIQYK